MTFESADDIGTHLLDSFLGGSAPRLISLKLVGISFPALPKLLLSATNLDTLSLQDVPAFGYLSVDAMVDCLSLLTRLDDLQLEYRSSDHPFDHTSRRPPPLTRTVLPVFTFLSFEGAAEYLEGIFASIEVPLLKNVYITFLNPGIFDVSRISMFSGLAKPFEGFDQAHIHFNGYFNGNFVDVTLSPQKRATGARSESLQFSIQCIGSVWRLERLSRNMSGFVPPYGDLEGDLERFDDREFRNRLSPLWTDGMESATSRWLELLRHFTLVETLYLSEGLAHCVAPALKGLTEDDVNGVLPALQTLFIEGLQPPGPVQVAIGEFVSARELTGHPVDVRCWVRERGPDQYLRESVMY
jgi:hypothetical protein